MWRQCFQFQIVQTIANNVSENTIEYIRQEKNEPKVECDILWGEHIQYNYIPYKRNKMPLAKLTKKPATESPFVKEISMKCTDDYLIKEKTSDPKLSSREPKSQVCIKCN